MISRYEAYMDGVALSSINPNLIIHDIQHNAAKPTIDKAALAHRNGAIWLNKTFDGTSVTITFELHIYGISERQKACQEVVRWAQGAILQTNDRIGQQLHVLCTEYPKIESAMDYTDEISMTFAAYNFPFWEEKTPAKLSLTGTSGEGTLFVPGNAGDALVEVTVKPNSTMANITLTVEDTSITITGAGATTSQPLVISYTDKGIQKIMRGTTSLLDKRTGSDDLIATSGKINSFSYSSSANVTVEFSVKGVWM